MTSTNSNPKSSLPSNWLELAVLDLNKQLNAYTPTAEETRQLMDTNELKATFIPSKARTQKPQE